MRRRSSPAESPSMRSSGVALAAQLAAGARCSSRLTSAWLTSESDLMPYSLTRRSRSVRGWTDWWKLHDEEQQRGRVKLLKRRARPDAVLADEGPAQHVRLDRVMEALRNEECDRRASSKSLLPSTSACGCYLPACDMKTRHA
eukprot:354732-Chlamydomonas_euryale.AAC.4